MTVGLKLALFGCGGIADTHWHGVKHIKTNVKLSALIDEVPQATEQMAERTGARAFTSREEAVRWGALRTTSAIYRSVKRLSGARLVDSNCLLRAKKCTR